MCKTERQLTQLNHSSFWINSTRCQSGIIQFYLKTSNKNNIKEKQPATYAVHA